jgi:hypothetical protein
MHVVFAGEQDRLLFAENLAIVSQYGQWLARGNVHVAVRPQVESSVFLIDA